MMVCKPMLITCCAQCYVLSHSLCKWQRKGNSDVSVGGASAHQGWATFFRSWWWRPSLVGAQLGWRTAWLAHSCPPIRLYSFQRRIQVAAEARGFVVLRFQVPTSSEICPCWVDSELACEKPCACEHCLFCCTAHLHTSWWSVCVSCERMPNSRPICCFNANVKSISIHYRFGSFFSLTPSAP